MIEKCLLYITDNTYPYKNLAIEEYLTKTVKPGEIILFLWQNRRSVIIGRNQNSYKECNTEALEADGGFLVRRLSGGGAVFHDLGNLNFTFCVQRPDYDLERQTEVILRAVRSLGIAAERTGRNDITVAGRKFSGNAFWRTGECCYHHGTILLDTDGAAMQKYLNPDKEKLKTKGVDSVRARVCNLSEYAPDISVKKMISALQSALCEVYKAEAEEISQSHLPEDKINEAQKRFASHEWIYGKNTDFDYSFGRRFAWGNVQIGLCVKANVIKDVMIESDALNQDAIRLITAALEECEYSSLRMIKAVQDAPVADDLSGADTLQMKNDVAELIKECV